MTPGTMNALQYNAKKSELQLIKATVGKPGDDEVVVKVAYSGICGTDLHVTEGAFPCRQNVPVTLGHEFSGVVEAVGKNVTHVKVGDKVAIDPNSGCHTCRFCTSGNYHFCKVGGINNTVGLFRDGGWADYCVAPSSQVLKVPDSITLEQAALTEPLSCVSHGWDLISPIPVGSKILILGAGIIGNLWSCVLHLQGHRNVIVSEPQEARRNLLRNLDTNYEIISPDELRQKREKDPEWGVDLVIDCSGYAPAMEESINYLNPGGKYCIFGVASPSARVSISPYQLYKQEIKIIAVNINPFSFNKALGWIEAMGDRYLDYEKLGVKTFPVTQYKEALQELRKGSIAKGIFKFAN